MPYSCIKGLYMYFSVLGDIFVQYERELSIRVRVGVLIFAQPYFY